LIFTWLFKKYLSLLLFSQDF